MKREEIKFIREAVAESARLGLPNLPYGREVLREFVSYWLEKGSRARKYRWEKEKTWETGRRLATWRRNYEKWNRVTQAQVLTVDENRIRL